MKKKSTGGMNGTPKIVYIDVGMPRELYGHGCLTTEEAEEYLKIFPKGSTMHIVYDEPKGKVRTYELPTVTEADQVGEFASYTLGSIAGIQLVKSLTENELRQCLRNTKTFKAVLSAIGDDTNPSWLKSRAAVELYDRELIDERELDRHSD